MNCPKCNHPIKDTAKFCENCGAKIEVDNSTVECPSCHARIPKDSKFCPDCGTAINHSTSFNWQNYYPFIGQPEQSSILFKKSQKFGYKDIRTEAIICPPKFTRAQKFVNGYATVNDGRITDNSHLIDASFNPISLKRCRVDDELCNFEDVYDGCIYSWNNETERFAFFDLEGNTIFDFADYEKSAEHFSEGFCPVMHKTTKKYKYIDNNGHDAFTMMFDYAGAFVNGLAVVGIHDKYGIINRDGCLVIPPMYDDCGNFENELINVDLNNKWGFINKENTIVIPLIYEDARAFSGGLALVKKDGKWGCINIEGKTICPFIYDGAGTFVNGLCVVFKDGKAGCINARGETVIPFEFLDIDDFAERYTCAKKELGWGVIDKTNNAIVDFKYKYRREGFKYGIATLEDSRYSTKSNFFGQLHIDLFGNTMEE